MWITRREIARLERELKAALQRALDAEARLVVERAARDEQATRKDDIIVQLASRVVTKAGGYGLDREPPRVPEVLPPAHPRRFIREPTELDDARLQFYIDDARRVGIPNPEEDATARWEAELRGESYMAGEQ
jgi:hypothetical protein